MSDNNRDDNNKYEDVCYICRRPESRAGRMIHLPDASHICMCVDCIERSFKLMNSSGMDYNELLKGMDLKDFPGLMNLNINPAMLVPPSQKIKKKPDTNGSGSSGMTHSGSPAGLQSGSHSLSQTGLQPSSPAGAEVSSASGKAVPAAAGANADTGTFDIRRIPAPHIIKSQLDQYVIGQDFAKKIISVAVYNHYKRVYTNTMDDIEIQKSNILMLGPTGSGKTYLVQTLARLLDVPLAITDATSLTEAGYIGDDIESVVSKLLAAADNDVEKAQEGIIFIDEIDKIAKKKNTTSRDVSGESVQQGLLKLLEGSEIEVPVGATSKNAMVPLVTVNTRNILFICGGAFPDLEKIVKNRLTGNSSIGFGAELKDRYDKDENILRFTTFDDLRDFGMVPEFLGRLPVVASLQSLDEEMLSRILVEPKNAIIKQYQKLLALDGVELLFEDDAIREIAAQAASGKTGARALRSIIEEFMLDIMFEIPKDKNIGSVTITKAYIQKKGSPIISILQHHRV